MAGAIDVKPLKIDLTPAARKITEKHGNACRDKIQAGSPEGATGEYADGWKAEFTDEDTVTVYQSNTKRDSLTWLLEKGHVIMRKGDQVGWSAARPHIRPAFLQERNLYLDDLKKIDITPQ